MLNWLFLGTSPVKSCTEYQNGVVRINTAKCKVFSLTKGGTLGEVTHAVPYSVDLTPLSIDNSFVDCIGRHVPELAAVRALTCCWCQIWWFVQIAHPLSPTVAVCKLEGS